MIIVIIFVVIFILITVILCIIFVALKHIKSKNKRSTIETMQLNNTENNEDKSIKENDENTDTYKYHTVNTKNENDDITETNCLYFGEEKELFVENNNDNDNNITNEIKTLDMMDILNLVKNHPKIISELVKNDQINDDTETIINTNCSTEMTQIELYRTDDIGEYSHMNTQSQEQEL